MTLEEMKRFCAEDNDPRIAIRNPWTRDGYTWATNGHIIVRVPAIEGVAKNDLAPDAQKLWDKQSAPTEWILIPDITMPADIPCKWCDGTKKDPEDRRYKCEDCRGTGMQHDMSGFMLGDVWFAKRYLAMLRGWEIAPNGLKAAWIRKGEVLGLLMPQNR